MSAIYIYVIIIRLCHQQGQRDLGGTKKVDKRRRGKKQRLKSAEFEEWKRTDPELGGRAEKKMKRGEHQTPAGLIHLSPLPHRSPEEQLIQEKK